MTFTLGRDLGLVMAKGVIWACSGLRDHPAVPGSWCLDKPLQRTRHKSRSPIGRLRRGGVQDLPRVSGDLRPAHRPAYISYDKTNDEVYYDMGQCLPEDMEYVIANKKLSEEFDIASTHMVLLVNADLPDSDVRAMIDEMEQVPGVKYVGHGERGAP